MIQILNSWNMLEPQKKIVVVLAAIATLVAFFDLVRVVNTPSMALLYSGLDSATSGEIVASLEQKSIPFEIRGEAIYVDSTERDQARLSLASEGLPSNGIAGYELLDSLSGFGTTSQMFDAAYWRAKEGELARTILASARISMARVHIANAVQQPFSRGVEPSASVTVSVRSGILDIGQAEAIRYLVAAAVSGMVPEQVAVIDTEYGIILQPGTASNLSTGTGELDARAQELRANVERLLAARVGAGNAVVEVMIEAQNESETVTERILDPDRSVPISSDSETNTETSSGGAGGAVTVASNLPDTGDSAGSGQNSRNQSQSRERINYEVSETIRERVHLAGDIARLSVAVLINYETITDANGATTIAPRSEAEISAFQALVQSAVGFNAERGDVITIETMQFPEPPILGTTASGGFLSGYAFNIPAMLQMAVLAIVTLALGMFVVKPILTNPAPQLNQLPLKPMAALGSSLDYEPAGT
ncbi:MAG: flagellar basal-body MS-ring/collar protein FliF, partial [Alphaproteobacteria bacterium]